MSCAHGDPWLAPAVTSNGAGAAADVENPAIRGMPHHHPC